MEEETQSSGPTKKCPQCKELIQVSAKKCPHCQSDLRSWINKHPILTFFLIIMGIILFPVIMATIGETPATKNTATQPTQTAVNQVSTITETDPAKRIEAIVKSVTGKSEITIWDSKEKMATEKTQPPYEVVVNAGKGDIASCYYAKNVAFEIMKKLYTDAIVKDKISRVLFGSWGHLRVSVGSDNGTKTDWNGSGPTNFWKVMMQYKPYEDETGALDKRTWGKAIANDCN